MPTAMVIALYVIVALALFRIFFEPIPAYTGAIIGFFGKPIRSVGPGLAFMFYPLELVTHLVSLEKKAITFSNDFEIQDNNDIQLTVIYEHAPRVDRLIQYKSFQAESFQNLITERIKAVLLMIIRGYKNREKVLNNLTAIAARAKTDFAMARAENGELLPYYYGIELMAVSISDSGNPPQLKSAALERQVAERLNSARDTEVENLKLLARSLVQEAKKDGCLLDFESALHVIQSQFGKAKKSVQHRVYGINGSTIDGLAGALERVLRNRQPRA